MSLSKVGDQATTDGLRQILCGTRKELDEERMVSRNLKKEIDRLSSRIEGLQVEIRKVYCLTHFIEELLIRFKRNIRFRFRQISLQSMGTLYARKHWPKNTMYKYKKCAKN